MGLIEMRLLRGRWIGVATVRFLSFRTLDRHTSTLVVFREYSPKSMKETLHGLDRVTNHRNSHRIHRPGPWFIIEFLKTFSLPLCLTAGTWYFLYSYFYLVLQALSPQLRALA